MEVGGGRAGRGFRARALAATARDRDRSRASAAARECAAGLRPTGCHHIEGAQSSLSDLLLFELEEAPGVPIDDVLEVSGYVAALEHGLARLVEGFPLANRLTLYRANRRA
jgi:hypothetical protein